MQFKSGHGRNINKDYTYCMQGWAGGSCRVCMSWAKGGKLHGPIVNHLAIVTYNVVGKVGVEDDVCIRRLH